MAGTSVKYFEVHISPSLVFPQALEESKWSGGMAYMFFDKEVYEPLYVRADGVDKEGGCEEGRLKDEISACG